MYIKLVLNLARGQSEGMKAALTGLGWWQAGIYCRVSRNTVIPEDQIQTFQAATLIDYPPSKHQHPVHILPILIKPT